MKKVIVIGCPGSGKSTFSGELSAKTGIPLFHLDMMFWNSDKTSVEKAVFIERLKAVLQKGSWIIDGNYASTMEMRLKECDTVFFLDYPLEVCLDGIKARKGKARSDMPWIENADEEDAEFISFIKSFNEKSRPAVIDLLKKYEDKTIFIFRDRTDSAIYLDNLP